MKGQKLFRQWLPSPRLEGFCMGRAGSVYGRGDLFPLSDYADYTHILSKARILKAQHPNYEIAQMGIHGERGVSCADLLVFFSFILSM